MRLYYNISGSIPIYDGRVEVDIDDCGDFWNVSYRGKVRLGKKIWGKFIGKTEEFAKTRRFPKEVLTENFVKNMNNYEYQGIKFSKVSTGEIGFTVSEQGVKGNIIISFDGFEPVDINAVRVIGSYWGISADIILKKA